MKEACVLRRSEYFRKYIFIKALRLRVFQHCLPIINCQEGFTNKRRVSEQREMPRDSPCVGAEYVFCQNIRCAKLPHVSVQYVHISISKKVVTDNILRMQYSKRRS